MITVNKIDDLLKYFHQELAYLRNKGGEFAERYPKVAGYLDLGQDGSKDPHVDRIRSLFNCAHAARYSEEISRIHPTGFGQFIPPSCNTSALNHTG